MVEPEKPFPLDEAKAEPGITVPGTFHDALRGIADRRFLASQNWQEQQWRAVREGCHPDLLEFERLFMKRMVKLGVPMFTHEMLRTAKHQSLLLLQGVTKAGPGESPHQYGCAFDLVHSVKAWNLERKAWDLIGHVGKELATQRGFKVTWGGDWSFWDPAHWELDEWREVKRLIDADPAMWPTAKAVHDWKVRDAEARKRLA